MIRLVIFDVDGVLVHYDRRRRMEVMAHCLGRSVDEVTAAVFDSGAEDRADAGQTNADEYLRELGEHLGAPVTRDVWVTARVAAVTPDPAMVDLVERVARRTRVALLTNNGSLLRAEFDRIAPEVAAIPDVRLFSSGDLRLAKPDPSVFHAVIGHYGVAPADTLFVDDSAGYVDGARRAGLRTHVFDGYDALVARLGDEGVTTE